MPRVTEAQRIATENESAALMFFRETLGNLTDPRRPQGIRYPLQSVVVIGLMAMVCGCDDAEAMECFGEVRLAGATERRCKSKPGALTQGTRHREDKGVVPGAPGLGDCAHELAQRLTREGTSGGVVGARSRRTKVKRRKASVLGEPAPRGEARFASGSTGVLATT